MNTGILDVLGNGMDEELSLVSNGVDVNFLSIIDEFGDDNRVKRRDRCCCGEVVLQSRFLVYDIHGCAGEDVRWTNKDWVPELNIRTRTS